MKAAFLALASTLCLAPTPLAAQSTAAAVLEVGTPVERSLSGEEIHRYSIAVAPGQYLRIVLDPRGAGLRARLHGPDQSTLAETEKSESDSDPLTLMAIAPAGGRYRLEVLREASTNGGNYQLRIAELRAGTPEDEKRIAAFRADAEGDRLRAQETAEARRQAIDKYSAALESWQAAHDAGGEASTLTKIGALIFNMGDRAKSLQYRLREVALRKDLGDRRLEARALQSAGGVYANIGQPAKALELLAPALEIQKELGDRQGQATTLNSQAFLYYSTGEPQKALELLEEALPLRRSVADRSGEAYTLHSLGTIYLSMAEQQKALEYFERALPIWRAASNRRGEGTTIGNMAMVHSALGHPQQALELLNQSLTIQKAAGDRAGEATVYNNFALVYGLMGQAAKSVEYLNLAIELHRANSDRNGEATGLNNLGTAYRVLGDRRKALQYQAQAVAIQRETRNRLGEGISLNSMGATYREAGEWQKALESYGLALPLLRANGDRRQEGGVLTGMASVYLSLGQPEKALECVGQAQSLLHSIGASLEEASALYLFARVEREQKHSEEARQRITQALDLAESLRQNVAAQELRSSYFATVREQFALYIDLLMTEHRERPDAGLDAQALQVSERARARGLLDLLAESQADLREGVDPALLAEERSLEALLSAKAARQVQVLAGKHSTEQANAAEKEIRALTSRYQQVRAEIRARSPHYAALTQPRSLSVAEIQRDVLDPQTVLLEYWLGEERSFLWEITQSSLRSYELPKRAVLEAAARDAYASLSAPGGDTSKPLAAISRMLLAPAASGLGYKRLLVVPEGALQFLPFSTLVDPRTLQPLLAKHEVVNLPSASTLSLLRSELAGRKPVPRTVAVLADPVFRADDSRIRGADGVGGGLPEEIQRSAGEAGLQDLIRLRGSRREAEGITSLAPAGSSLQALDFRASRATATSGELARYRIIHFATHALLNSQHPELSGLVLSLVDERGRPQNGFLQAHEIYNLKLNADLVVLSACQTALGQDVRSEGVIGITRGFMYAGAPRVVASLWKVPDQATGELMRRFYEGMLARKLPPGTALRQAQLALSKDRDYAHPYYWAGFTLQGEWK